ncbi:MAG TPA: hypothetical protein VFX79_02025 [Candidatus Saccharimonadales bacterium]|nr:hypothetical protein [Candidatus Saccharimonadales bacterium]
MNKEKKEHKDFKLKLPNRIAGTSDLAKTQRELEKVDDFLYQTNIRMPGRPVTLPKSSKMLDDLAEINGVSLLEEADRKELLQALEKLSETAAVMHISFAAEPSNSFLEKIVDWARTNIDPFVLVNVGLQPSVIVGCEVRTTNKVFDMSLRNKFEHMHDVLAKKLGEIND